MKRKTTAEQYPPISQRTRVLTLRENRAIRRQWRPEALLDRRWGVLGRVLNHHDSHGLCYEVTHSDGKVRYYDPSELKVLPEINLFTITTLGELDGRPHDRTPAVCTSLERAKEIIETNEGDLYEAGWYPLAVIEVKPSDNVYPEVTNIGKRRSQWWYRFDTRQRRYVLCGRPKQFRRTSGFGVG